MNILFFGDIVGRVARKALVERLADIKSALRVDFIIANGENAAGGFGITRDICEQLFDAGIDVITLGNHAWDQRDILTHIEREPRLMRPANYPHATPGRGVALFTAGDKTILMITVMGQLFMESLDNPFTIVEKELAACQLGVHADAIIVELHGEATSEKMAMGHFCDGRASLVVGTHTHVPTADAHILTHGTAYQTDLGMCGDYDSVIGMEKDEPLQRFTSKLRGERLTPALGEPSLCGALVRLNPQTGLAEGIEAVRIGGRLSPTHNI